MGCCIGARVHAWSIASYRSEREVFCAAAVAPEKESGPEKAERVVQRTRMPKNGSAAVPHEEVSRSADLSVAA